MKADPEHQSNSTLHRGWLSVYSFSDMTWYASQRSPAEGESRL